LRPFVFFIYLSQEYAVSLYSILIIIINHYYASTE